MEFVSCNRVQLFYKFVAQDLILSAQRQFEKTFSLVEEKIWDQFFFFLLVIFNFCNKILDCCRHDGGRLQGISLAVDLFNEICWNAFIFSLQFLFHLVGISDLQCVGYFPRFLKTLHSNFSSGVCINAESRKRAGLPSTVNLTFGGNCLKSLSLRKTAYLS